MSLCVPLAYMPVHHVAYAARGLPSSNQEFIMFFFIFFSPEILLLLLLLVLFCLFLNGVSKVQALEIK